MTWTILQADARHIPLAANSVQCVVTSPPYWGLRDYGTATWVGGDQGCDHRKLTDAVIAKSDETRTCGANDMSNHAATPFFKDVCRKCGATRIDSQIGLEPTPEEYVAKIVAMFAEVWRVLRDDGVVFCNLGDSYASATKGSGGPSEKQLSNAGSRYEMSQRLNHGLKDKDLCGIPWRVAFALQAAGWYLRSDIIWAKPNPMPESVTDRPTKSHEYIFLLSKKPNYYFDQDAVKEASLDDESYRPRNERNPDKREGDKFFATKVGNHANGKMYPTRNIRTVWEIATQPYPEAHFATFPEEIAIRCIKAGTSERGACAECGAPWERVIEKSVVGDWRSTSRKQDLAHGAKGGPNGTMPGYEPPRFIGWQPTCKHNPNPYKVPCIVLDPFSGAGTVPLVADKLNRRGIGLELKSSYCLMASRRCYDDAPLLTFTP